MLKSEQNTSEQDDCPHEGTTRETYAEEDTKPVFSTPKKLKTCSSSAPVNTDYCFYLTTVANLEDKWNANALSLSDILAQNCKELERSAQFNFTIHPECLLPYYPAECRSLPLLLVTSRKSSSLRELKSVIKQAPNVQLVDVNLPSPYGSHHSKMMLLKYSSGVRVVIHTANLITREWHQKTQGVYLSPVFPPVADEADESDSPTNFKKDLLAYLRAYNEKSISEWCDIISKHDFRQAKVYFVASVPGRHQGESMAHWGHAKLQHLLSKHLKVEVDSSWPLVCQFSAMGFLGFTPDAWLLGEFSDSLKQAHGQTMSGSPDIKLIYPCVEDVRCSLEGYDGGWSLPYPSKIASKQDYLKSFFHRWRSECNGRSRACPHIKTYLRCNATFDKMAWFLLTSANLSKTAWGSYEENATEIFIRSFEVGVLFLPHVYNQEVFALNRKDAENEEAAFPVPYDLPPERYGSTDEPWIDDVPYLDEEDSHGNYWDV